MLNIYYICIKDLQMSKLLLWVMLHMVHVVLMI